MDHQYCQTEEEDDPTIELQMNFDKAERKLKKTIYDQNIKIEEITH